jgi:GNAT superfamily N-acetyltransferase
MTTDPAVRAGSSVDTVAAGALIAQAFADLPTAQWLVADREVRVRLLSEQFSWFAEHGLKHGVVDTVGDEAVGVWFDNTADAPWIDRYDERMAELVGDRYPRFGMLDETFAAHHPHKPHFHLALLATRPDRQGSGLGGVLLERRLAKLDEAGIAAYLEAAEPRSAALYARHGFEPLGEPFHLPQDGPPMFPMWREPR